MSINKLFDEIEENLEASRKVFVRTNFDEDEESIRSLSDSETILSTLREMALASEECFKKYPALESLFEKEFGKFSQIFNRDALIQTVIAEDYLIADAEEFPLPAEQQVSKELLDNYKKSYLDWLVEIQTSHKTSQEFLLNNFDPQKNYSELDCHCMKCSADYRAKLR